MVRMKDEKYYLHVSANAAPEKDETSEFPVYVRRRNSQLDRELDERRLFIRVSRRAFSNVPRTVYDSFRVVQSNLKEIYN